MKKIIKDINSNKYEVVLENSESLIKAAKIFKNNGFVILKKSIPKYLIKKIHLELKKKVKQNKIGNKLRDIHFFKDGTISSAHNLVNYIPSYSMLLKIPQIKKFAEEVFGELSKKHFNSSYFAKPKKQGLETKPHQDNAFFCMDPPQVATFWMPITFANKKNGCLYYYPKSHTFGNIKHKPEGNLGASMTIPEKFIKKVKKKYVKKYIELKLGDCVIHNSLVVHGSDANVSNIDRNAFNFSIAGKLAKRNENLYKNYQNNLSLFLLQKKRNENLKI